MLASQGADSRDSGRRPGGTLIDPALYERAKALFLEASERPESDRDAYLAERAGADSRLLAEVRSLLANAHSHAGAEFARGSLFARAALPASVGPYRVLGELGRGGMGVVLRAAREAGGEVALKLLDTPLVTPQVRRRFERETAVMARMSHPAIAPLLDSGTLATDRGPRPWFAMPIVAGASLAERAADPSWDMRARIALVAAVAVALGHAHALGVVHRDLKPSNIMVTPDGSPMVLDFGIARLTDADARETLALTGSGEILGTVRYMSPEQAQGLLGELDGRTDVYSLAVVLYELLTGRLPYDLKTRSLTRALVQVATEPPRPLGAGRPELRGSLEAILERALEKSPRQRYASASAFAADLRAYLEGRTVAAARGRAWRRVQALLRTRAGSIAAAGGALLVTAILASLAVPTVRHLVPPLAQLDLRRLYARLDRADALNGAPRPTREGLQAALAEYERGRRELSTYPASPLLEDLVRYLDWRIGETQYTLGTLEGDAERLEAAIRSFEQINPDARPRGYRTPLDSTIALAHRIQPFAPEMGQNGSAMARTALAGIRDRRGNVAIALRQRTLAISTFGVSLHLPGGVPENWSPPWYEHSELSNLFNLWAESATELALLDSNRALVEQAIPRLWRAASDPGIRQFDRVALASVQHNLGLAHLARDWFTHDDGELDTAEVVLREALVIRVERQRRSRVDTRVALAELERRRAVRQDAVAAVTHWTRGLVQIAAAEHELDADSAAAPAYAPVLEEWVDLLLDRAERTGDRSRLNDAARILDDATRRLGDWRANRRRAEFEIRRARLARLGGVANAAAQVQVHLEAARALLSADEDPDLLRLVTRESARPAPDPALRTRTAARR